MVTKAQMVAWLTDSGWIWVALIVIATLFLFKYFRNKKKTIKSNVIEQYSQAKKRGRPKKELAIIEGPLDDEDLISLLENDLQKWMEYRKDLLDKRGERVHLGNQLRAEIQEIDKKLKFLNNVLEKAGLLNGKDENKL